jgi:N-methylhydantoinase B
VPVNGGAFRSTRFTIPKGCILAAEYPSAVGGTTDVVQRVVDVVFGALAQAIPLKTPAAPFGTTGVSTVSGTHPETGKFYIAVYPYPGGYGASHVSDGLINGTPPGSMAKFMSVEMSEHRYPVRFAYLGIRENSGGSGMHRGGCGTRYGIETLGPALVSILGDRVDHVPFGVEGGGPAAPNVVELRTNGNCWIPPMRSKAEKVPFHNGDSFHLGSPGGGGFGDPLTREIALVEADLNAGLVDLKTAETTYGVVVAHQRKILDRGVFTLDPKTSTEKRRRLAKLRAQRKADASLTAAT